MIFDNRRKICDGGCSDINIINYTSSGIDLTQIRVRQDYLCNRGKVCWFIQERERERGRGREGGGEKESKGKYSECSLVNLVKENPGGRLILIGQNLNVTYEKAYMSLLLENHMFDKY